MVDFLCFSLVLSAVFHLPLAYTLPRVNTGGAAGDLTGAMVSFVNHFPTNCIYHTSVGFLFFVGQLSDCKRQSVNTVPKQCSSVYVEFETDVKTDDYLYITSIHFSQLFVAFCNTDISTNLQTCCGKMLLSQSMAKCWVLEQS